MDRPVGSFAGVPIYISRRGNKKYYALVDGRQVHFGDRGYQHYYDKIGAFSHLNHLDPARRLRYKQRHEKDRHVKWSPGWFADRILW